MDFLCCLSYRITVLYLTLSYHAELQISDHKDHDKGMVSTSIFFLKLYLTILQVSRCTLFQENVLPRFRERILCQYVCESFVTITTTRSKCALALLPRTMPITTKHTNKIYLTSLGWVPVVYYNRIIVGKQFIIQQLLYPDFLVSSGASVFLKAAVFLS